MTTSTAQATTTVGDYTAKVARAYKPHTCARCQDIIMPGEYHYHYFRTVDYLLGIRWVLKRTHIECLHGY